MSGGSGEAAGEHPVELEAGIVTGDLAALVGFYVDGMGFVTETLASFPEGDVQRLRRGRARLKLYQPAEGAEEPLRPDPWHRRAGFAYGALLVGDAGEEVERAVDHGAVVLREVTRHRPDARFALIADPEGNVWELLEESS